jgi:hypothetical protein
MKKAGYGFRSSPFFIYLSLSRVDLNSGIDSHLRFAIDQMEQNYIAEGRPVGWKPGMVFIWVRRWEQVRLEVEKS